MSDICKNCGWPLQACSCDYEPDEVRDEFVRHLESTPVDDSLLQPCSHSDAATEEK